MNDFIVSAMLLGALSTGGTMPFWAVSNQNGIMPDRNGALALVQAYKPFDESKTFQWHTGLSLAANWQPDDPLNPASSPLRGMVDELYAGARWKVLRADIGVMHREREFMGSDPVLGSLSVNEGHIVESNNAPAMPGYSLILEPWSIPFTNDHLKISGRWGDYRTMDDRYIQGALVHRMLAYLAYDTGKHFYIRLGLDHYALWGGNPPYDPSLPESAQMKQMNFDLRNYFRICTGSSAGSDGSASDQANVLGDHGGAESLRMGWRYDGFDVTFQYEKPYSDKSGMKLFNIPDGAYTLQWSHKDKDRWISDALVEFHYTMWQSGARHDPEFDADGNYIPWVPGLNYFGGDSYFTNGEFASGWTHFGRSLCGPLFYTQRSMTGETRYYKYGDEIKAYGGGIWQIYNNRYVAYHVGISGKLFRFAPYRLMLTYSQNYGTYTSPLVPGATSWDTDWQWWKPNTWDKPLPQFSAALNGYVPFYVGWSNRLDIVYGLYVDAGKVLKNSFGATLGVRFTLQH